MKNLDTPVMALMPPATLAGMLTNEATLRSENATFRALLGDMAAVVRYAKCCCAVTMPRKCMRCDSLERWDDLRGNDLYHASRPVAQSAFTFTDLCEMEPQLADMEGNLRRLRDPGGPAFCANEVWAEDIKPFLERIVGWKATDPRLQSSAAYEVATVSLYSLLPPCRRCGCL